MKPPRHLGCGRALDLDRPDVITRKPQNKVKFSPRRSPVEEGLGSGEELDTTLHRYVWLYNQQLPQSALGSKTPFAGDEGLARTQTAVVQKAAILPAGM